MSPPTTIAMAASDLILLPYTYFQSETIIGIRFRITTLSTGRPNFSVSQCASGGWAGKLRGCNEEAGLTQTTTASFSRRPGAITMATAARSLCRHDFGRPQSLHESRRRFQDVAREACVEDIGSWISAGVGSITNGDGRPSLDVSNMCSDSRHALRGMAAFRRRWRTARGIAATRRATRFIETGRRNVSRDGAEHGWRWAAGRGRPTVRFR